MALCPVNLNACFYAEILIEKTNDSTIKSIEMNSFSFEKQNENVCQHIFFDNNRHYFWVSKDGKLSFSIYHNLNN